MMSTQRQSRRESTSSKGSDSGDEYSDYDRRVISAATDVAIASLRAMGPSAFATGHLPDDKDDEAKPDTLERDEAAATSSSRSTTWRNPKKAGKKDKKTKKNMGNKALIVSSNWGGPIQGGVTDAVHLLIRLLHKLGISTYCTTLTATEEEIKEAKEYGVELITPSPVGRFKSRNGTPDPDWLYHHKDYFPNLKELANVRFVFGFGMITSEAAFEIERDVFKKAEFYLVNLFDSDFITPVIAKCDDGELDYRREKLSEEAQNSSGIFSVGGSTFKEYEKIYRQGPDIKHSRLSPIIDDNLLKIPSPAPVDDDGVFQILTVFQEHELAYLTSDSAIVKAMNAVADSFQKTRKQSLKWKILGVPKRCESTLLERMDPGSNLCVVLARMPSAKTLNNELSRTNLVLLHQFSVYYVNLTLAAMCAAVPVIIAKKSQSHELVRVHMPEYEESVVVDMSKFDKLQDRIHDFLCNYEVALKRAKDIKTEIEGKVAPELENINNDFVRLVEDDAENKHGIELKGEKQPTWTKRVVRRVIDKIKKRGMTESQKPSRKRKIQERDPGDMKVKVRVSEVVAQRGRTVEEVERGFYASDEVKEKTEEIRQTLDGQHDEMEVKGTGQESISFTMSCQSLDALEFLRSEYEKGRLQDMMEDKFLPEKLLDKIGAYHLDIDVTIDYEEYFLCRKELIQKYGLPVKQKGTANILYGKQDTTERAFKRVNRARALLKEFEMEGTQVTEDQINMLDQLLQEKEEKRRTEAQKSQLQKHTEHMVKDPAMDCQLKQLPGDSAFAQITDVHLLSDEEITEKNEALEAKVSKLTISSGMVRSQNRDRGRGREDLQSEIVEGDRVEERKLNTIFSEFVGVKTETRDLVTNHPEVVMKAEKLSAFADDIVREAEIPEETKEVYLKVRQVERGLPVKESVLEVFGNGSMPGQFIVAEGIYIKNNGQWVICDYGNHRVQIIDPIKLCCDLILQFHAFPKSFNPEDVTVDEDNDQYFMSDRGNGQVVVSSGQSKILNCFGRKEGIDPTGICLSPDGFIFIGDMNGYVRKYNKSGEHIARTEEGQVSVPWDLIVNKKCIFVSDFGRNCVHVLNHQMQSIRDIGKGHLEGPMGMCLITNKMAYMFVITLGIEWFTSIVMVNFSAIKVKVS
ncbi:uncharacterized protein [Ptychodera flava]|uniref:uncharacterized protein n=1 Tax=Ptychodera flava TaxID=63121 RepID=UPI00396AA9C5